MIVDGKSSERVPQNKTFMIEGGGEERKKIEKQYEANYELSGTHCMIENMKTESLKSEKS